MLTYPVHNLFTGSGLSYSNSNAKHKLLPIQYPCMIGKLTRIGRQLVSHLDWVPTLLAASREPDVREKLLTGHQANGRDYRVHPNGGYHMLDYLLSGFGSGTSSLAGVMV
jgi:hypothetical protein